MTGMTDNSDTEDQYVTKAAVELANAQNVGAAQVLALAAESRESAPSTAASADAQAAALALINRLINDIPHTTPTLVAWAIANEAVELISALAAKLGTDATEITSGFAQDLKQRMERDQQG